MYNEDIINNSLGNIKMYQDCADFIFKEFIHITFREIK